MTENGKKQPIFSRLYTFPQSYPQFHFVLCGQVVS